MSDRCAGCGVIRVADDLYRSADGVWWHGDCAAARLAELEAELERTRQAWVDGDDPLCEDVCVVACKGPCGVSDDG